MLGPFNHSFTFESVLGPSRLIRLVNSCIAASFMLDLQAPSKNALTPQHHKARPHHKPHPIRGAKKEALQQQASSGMWTYLQLQTKLQQAASRCTASLAAAWQHAPKPLAFAHMSDNVPGSGLAAGHTAAAMRACHALGNHSAVSGQHRHVLQLVLGLRSAHVHSLQPDPTALPSTAAAVQEQGDDSASPGEIQWDIEVPEAGAEAEEGESATEGPSIDWDIEDVEPEAAFAAEPPRFAFCCSWRGRSFWCRDDPGTCRRCCPHMRHSLAR